MYFWAEKYFSGSSLDQQQQGSGGARRTSRSGSGDKIDRKSSFLHGAEKVGEAEHRKSVGQLGTRRESRERGGGGTQGAAPQSGGGGAEKEKTQQQKGKRKSLASAGIATNVTGGSSGRGAAPPPLPPMPQQQHRGSTLSELAAAATFGGGGAGSAAGSASGATILLNIARALIVRALLMAHSFLCIWAASETRGDNSVWAFGLLAVCLVGEGFYAIVVRAGDDPKWFSPAIMLYLFATIPPLWLVNISACSSSAPSASSVGLNISSSSSSFASLGLQPYDHAVPQQLLHHSLFLVLLAARWLLPRAEMSREDLTQVLLAYVSICTDISEFFFGLLGRHRQLCAEHTLQTAVISAWALSLVQFTMVLTASRARKARIALATKIIVTTNCRPDFRQAFYDVDIWTVLISLCLQDIPFLLVRLGVLAWFWHLDFGQLLFLAKNLLIILLQSYRISVLLNDRYLNPPLDARARTLIEERRQSMIPSKNAKMSLANNGGRTAGGAGASPTTQQSKQQ